MPQFLTVIILIALVLLIIGLINPRKALFWSIKPATSKQSSLIYGVIILVCCIGVGITAPDVAATENGDLNNKINEPAIKVIRSRREGLRALARNCDTIFTFMDDSTGFDHDTGWVIAGNYQPWYGRNALNMDTWEIPTYKTPSLYDIDENKKLRIYQKVVVRAFHKSQTKKSRICWYTISPIGSKEQYIVEDLCFTLKDITQCSIKQKAKNGFVVKALYKAPTDPNKRAHEGGGNDAFHPIDIPSGSIVLVLDYRPEYDWMWGNVYSNSGKELGSALFYESTLTEIK